MSTPSLHDFEKKLEDLPVLPSVAVKLLTLSANDKDYFNKVVLLAREDPHFSLQVIKISNSASSSPAKPITDIKRAVIRIGAHRISGLVSTMAVMRIFFPKTDRDINLWVHAIRTAVAAKTVASIMPSLRVDPETAYLCGLLSDIGRFVLMDLVTTIPGYEDKSDWLPSSSLVDIEKEMYGIDHAELGAKVCCKWGMPDIVTTVVENHHHFELPQLSLPITNLIRVIQMADSLATFLIMNPDWNTWDLPDLHDRLNVDCVKSCCSNPPLSAEQVAENLESITINSNQVISGLGISFY